MDRMSAVMGSPITRHEGEHLDDGFEFSCRTSEGPLPAWTQVEECHYCLIAETANLANDPCDCTTHELGPKSSAHLGLREGTLVRHGVALRAAAEIMDDVAVLRMLDRIEAR